MNILLGDGVKMDLDKAIESRVLIQANSGGGKSWAARRFIEQSFGKKQIIVIDPEGEFGNMRKEYDFVYIGQGGDAPAEPRSAALLARRLLETKANAIIDIYELGSRRNEFIKAFFEACVNMPKELWTDCFFILDEAHKAAPEKGQGESVALQSVIDMASLGRKRGYCLIPATQRPAKLSKDVVAECNNKLIGRASLDIDRERSAKELGFRSREDILSLRDLAPGEFYVFGPAITNEVTKIHIGDVKVKPPKRGTGRTMKIAPPTAKVKAILAKLADLPQEAQKEATTAAELKTALASARAEITRLNRQGAAVEPSKELQQKWYDLGVAAVETSWRAECERVKADARKDLSAALSALGKIAKITGTFVDVTMRTDQPIEIRIPREMNAPAKVTMERVPVYGEEDAPKPLSKGARSVLTYLHQSYPHWKSKTQMWVAAGYAPGGGFNNLVYELTGAGLIEKDGTGKFASLERHTLDQLEENFDASLVKWDAKLGLGARKIFAVLRGNPHEVFAKDQLAEITGYALGGGFNNLIYELTGKELIEKVGTGYQVNPEVLEL